MPRSLLFTAAVAGWPAVEAAGVALAGEPGWRAVVQGFPPPSPTVLRCLLSALAWPLLSASPAGQERLARWRAHPRPPEAETVSERVERTRTGLALVVGDGEAVDGIARIVAALPRPVGDLLVADVVVLVVGGRAPAWTSGSTFAGPDEQPRPHLICLSAEPNHAKRWPRLIAHEAGHVWHGSVDAPTFTALQQAEWTARGGRQVAHELLADEWLASACAAAWSGSNPDNTEGDS